MTRNDHDPVLILQRDQKLPDLLYTLFIQRIDRFIQNDQPRTSHNSCRNAKLLTHTERILPINPSVIRIQSKVLHRSPDCFCVRLPGKLRQKLKVLKTGMFL